VEEHADLYAPIRREQQLARDEAACRIIAPDVRLNVDARLSEAYAVHAYGECIETVWQETHARAAAVRCQQRLDRARERGCIRAHALVANDGRLCMGQRGGLHVVQAYQPRPARAGLGPMRASGVTKRSCLLDFGGCVRTSRRVDRAGSSKSDD